MSSKDKVDRHISFYEKFGEKYIGQIPLNEIKLQDLLDLVTFKEYKDDYLLYDCYLLSKEMLDKLSMLSNKPIEYELERYQYFLEATASE